MKTDYTREELIDICERAIVPEMHWHDRDTASAQEGVGKAWAWLKAGAPFTVEEKSPPTNERTIWIRIEVKGFGYFDRDAGRDRELIYLPTPARLESCDGRDWY